MKEVMTNCPECNYLCRVKIEGKFPKAACPKCGRIFRPLMQYNNPVKGDMVARISDDPGGYVFGDDSLPYIDARGYHYYTRREAIRAARAMGFTHYLAPSGRKVRL